jgi:hypothetical protein
LRFQRQLQSPEERGPLRDEEIHATISCAELTVKRPVGLGAQNKSIEGETLGIWILRMFSADVCSKIWERVLEYQVLDKGSIRLEIQMLGLEWDVGFGGGMKEGGEESNDYSTH